MKSWILGDAMKFWVQVQRGMVACRWRKKKNLISSYLELLLLFPDVCFLLRPLVSNCGVWGREPFWLLKGGMSEKFENHWLRRIVSVVTHTSEEGNRARQWHHCEDHDCAKSQPVGGDCVVLQSVSLEQEVVAFLQEIKWICKNSFCMHIHDLKESNTNEAN